MPKNLAIAIGINHYHNLQPLKYAQRDAELFQETLKNDVEFDTVLLFTDDSPQIPATPSSISTKPTFGNLRRFLRAQFEHPLLSHGDNLWFFFAGHGMRSKEQDYLMLADSDPGDVENTAISTGYVTERLRRSGADNVVLFIDACRSNGDRDGLGIGTDKHQGVISFFSCSPNQRSYEIDECAHGAFTTALTEGLRMHGESNCATVERLNQYLQYRVSEINKNHLKPRQTPYVITEPATKMYMVLVPKHASINDLEKLKNEALVAEVEGNIELAKQLWIRLNYLAKGSDMDVISAFSRIFSKNDSLESRVVSQEKIFKNNNCNNNFSSSEVSHRFSPDVNEKEFFEVGKKLEFDKDCDQKSYFLDIENKEIIFYHNKLLFYIEQLEIKKRENMALMKIIEKISDQISKSSQSINISGNIENFYGDYRYSLESTHMSDKEDLLP